jgi:D-proline reductase (dithiol) PrdB
MHGANFAEIEQAFVRERINSDFTWRAFDEYSSVNPLPVSLTDARVAFVTTCGAHLKDDPPFDIKGAAGDPSFRAFPSTTDFADLALTHRGYNTRRASSDMNVVLPLDHLRTAASDGTIGSLAPVIYSFMGFVADTGPLMEETVPELAERLRQDGADLVLLAPT